MVLQVYGLRCEYKENPLGIDVSQPRVSWKISSDARAVVQHSYQVQVALDPGFSEVVWDTNRVESNQSLHIVYEGPALRSRTRYYYHVRVWDTEGRESNWSEMAFWEMGLLESNEWVAQWMTSPDEDKPGCPLFRRTFSVEGPLKSATLFATALGVYELHLNGRRVGDWVLTPGWTSYHHQLQVQTYDVTEKLSEGIHVLGVTLGNGWYKGYLAWNGKNQFYGDQLASLLQLHLVYADGREQIVTSDSQWKTSRSAIQMSELYHGETYDARLEQPGWSTPDFEDSDWRSVRLLPPVTANIVAQTNWPTRVMEELQPMALLSTPAGETVIDMGQNMVGWMRISLRAPAGTVITLQHAEVLDKNGNFYTENLRSARQMVTYICKGGEAKESYEPHFSFQGFRYVKVEGYPGKLSLDDFVGCVVHSDFEQTGWFECSDGLVNQLQHNIVWGQKGNFLDVPTDCPQRDERLGWTGDAQVFIRTAAFNASVAPFFTKWLRDLQFDQLRDGAVPHVIPNVLGEEAVASAAWADAAVICPWTLYQCYGDTRILAEQYESMKAWVEYIRRQGEDELLWNTGFHFGDWLALDAQEGSYVGATPTDLIATAFYAYSTSLLARTARVLHRAADRNHYEALHARIVEKFQAEFVTASGRLVAHTQTAHVIALMFDLVQEGHRLRTIQTLARMIEENRFRLTTGFVGTPYLCRVLSENGYHDLACRLVRQTEYPSWLYSVEQGATTIWEHWDGMKPDGSFWSADMNSFNHYAYGSIGEWLYQILAGLDTHADSSGYQHILIRPRPDSAFSYAKASHESMFGRIRSEWRLDADLARMNMVVEIPVNTRATIVLPDASAEDVEEGGARLQLSTPGILALASIPEGLQVEAGSGVYAFSYPWQPGSEG